LGNQETEIKLDDGTGGTAAWSDGTEESTPERGGGTAAAARWFSAGVPLSLGHARETERIGGAGDSVGGSTVNPTLAEIETTAASPNGDRSAAVARKNGLTTARAANATAANGVKGGFETMGFMWN
jgi:hypothetical protein